MRLSQQTKRTADRCMAGKHDFGAHLGAALIVPRGAGFLSTTTAQVAPDVQVARTFIDRRCRGCGLQE